MSVGSEQRKLAAIMFTDMVGYSALSQRDDKLALELLEEHRQLLRELFPRFNGTEIKTIGDAFLIEFHSALEATQCAISLPTTSPPFMRAWEIRIKPSPGSIAPITNVQAC
jgi:class 3 adenylate cyclase